MSLVVFFKQRTAYERLISDWSADVCSSDLLRGFASSIGISFEQLAKNFSDANYSAARAALLDVWQGIMRLRFWFGQHVLSLIYGAVIEEAWAKRRLADAISAGAQDFYA